MKKKAEDKRPSWDEYFIEMARLTSCRSTCLRRMVGAVIVKDRRVIATGYNGAPSGLTHCNEAGCLREKLRIPSGERQEICRGLHAEQNAIIQAAMYGTSVQGGTLYCTHQPCVTCAKMIINAGINVIYWEGDYPDELALNILKEGKVRLKRSDTNKEEEIV